jgi:hypothetical protein
VKTYLRLMRRCGVTTHSEEERNALHDLLTQVPGVSQVEIKELHPKGGYRVTLVVPPNSMDGFITCLEERDWMAVL